LPKGRNNAIIPLNSRAAEIILAGVCRYFIVKFFSIFWKLLLTLRA
jgi:hypothetical protein